MAPNPTRIRPSLRPPAPGRGWRTWVLGGLALLAVGGGALALMLSSGAGRKARDEADLAAAPVEEALVLSAARRKDAAAFDAARRGEVLALRGVVDRREKREGAYGSGTKTVVFVRGETGFEFACWFDAERSAEADALQAGAVATLVGRYAGEGPSSTQEVVLRGCRAR